MLSVISSFSIWDWFQIVGTVMVLIGVCGELIADFKKFPYNPTGFESLTSAKRRIEISSLVILLLGLLFEVIALPHSLVEAAGLKKKADDAKLLAANTESNSIALSLRVEELRQINDELEAEIQPRRLTGESRSKLVKVFSGSPWGIVIVSTLMDGESEDFANDFDSIFHVRTGKHAA